ncbi:hypothetical protein [Sediminivirga luteola]|uniref:DoxX family membrane protein n=1 Tax=Sediminivirga luteola TaxID=1774748 RepID=A0A8J2TZB0_9MICO|nr:hypothetical protein [Sediminivirga luteola]MCI2264962.1 hypothetical protein [Sediminivirga luteola]GGA19614.1 hypothetical protein GCM10011333_23410 [Sediminivirga luteola]
MGNKIATAALRGVTGAFILNSGLGKLQLDEESAAGLREFASSGIPALKELDPATFKKLVSYGEIAVGSALLLPFVNKRLAGLALGAFSAGLLAIYFRNPALTEEDGVRPSQDGTAIAKDVWMAGIAAALIFGPSDKK